MWSYVSAEMFDEYYDKYSNWKSDPFINDKKDPTKEEVESRFVELSLKYHPDIGDEEIRDAEYFRTITESYKTFMNQEILNPGQGWLSFLIKIEISDFSDLLGRDSRRSVVL